ncbi:MAG: heparinase II/III family protein [Bacteroidales bacterium]|nr:heparinase II/III family protein [Bacteroidales bacterium]
MDMRFLIFIAAMAMLPLCSCMRAETEFSRDANSEKVDKGEEGPSGPEFPEDPELTEEDRKVNLELFEIINLDYPGLETVKSEYGQKHYALAAQALVEYYRNRQVVNTEIDLDDTGISAEYKRIADQALEYRFCVKEATWYESVMGLQYTYYSFDDGNGGIDWAFEAPGAGTEFYQKHWHVWFKHLAYALNSTGDDRYFDSWKEVYSDWLENFPCPESASAYGNRSWHQLSVASRISSQLNIIPYFLKSEKFTGDWLSTVLVEFYKSVEFSRANLYKTETSNIRFAQEVAEAKAGIMMPEFKAAAEWLSEGASAVSRQLMTQFNPDGTHNELALNYHLGVIDNFRTTYENARANDRLDAFSPEFLAYLHNACRLVMDYIWPDYTWEWMNDTFEQTKSVLLRNMRAYSIMFPEDEELKYMGTDGAEGTKPSATLRPYPDGGYYFLRNGWDVQSTMMIYSNNYCETGSTHCQPDNGTISLWSRGRNFLPDPGVYSYGGTAETDAMKAELRKTCSHNTLTKSLTDISSKNIRGKCLLSRNGDGYDVVVAENPSYSDLTHRRAVFMVAGKFYVIVDEAYGSAAGVPVNVSFHLCSDLTGGKGADVVTIDDGGADFYGAYTSFPDGNNMLLRTFSETTSGYKAENGISRYSPKLNTAYERKFYRVTANKAAASDVVRFITVIYPETGKAVSAEFKAPYSENSCSLQVSVNGSTYNLSYNL